MTNYKSSTSKFKNKVHPFSLEKYLKIWCSKTLLYWNIILCITSPIFQLGGFKELLNCNEDSNWNQFSGKRWFSFHDEKLPDALWPKTLAFSPKRYVELLVHCDSIRRRRHQSHGKLYSKLKWQSMIYENRPYVNKAFNTIRKTSFFQ